MLTMISKLLLKSLYHNSIINPNGDWSKQEKKYKIQKCNKEGKILKRKDVLLETKAIHTTVSYTHLTLPTKA